MERFDGPAYRHLAHFATLAKRTYGSMDLFFSVSLDRRRAGRGDFRDLEVAAADLGFQGSVAGLFHLLDVNLRNFIVPDDLAYLEAWVARDARKSLAPGDAEDLAARVARLTAPARTPPSAP